MGWSGEMRVLGMTFLEKKEVDRIFNLFVLKGVGGFSYSLVMKFWLVCRKLSKWEKR